MSFRDEFSAQAEKYAQYRPSYPQRLYQELASLAPGRALAWDCATGSGQAALGLAQHFDHVIASDASNDQIEHAFSHPRVEYRVEPAENSSIGAAQIDLVTAATAVHWFDLDDFYAEVRRAGKPQAVLAVWSYFFPNVDKVIDRWLRRFYYETLQGHWSERLKYVEDSYKSLPFPFEEIEPPEISMRAEWHLAQMMGFILSWSGTRSFIEQEGEAGLEEPLLELEAAWGEPEQKRSIEWPLFFRIERLPRQP